MIMLKTYQQRVLDSLREFFGLCSKTGSQAVAIRVVSEQTGGELTEEFTCAQLHFAGRAERVTAG